MSVITVQKHDAHGHFVLAYTGEVIAQNRTTIHLRAVFQGKTTALGHNITLANGDIMHEWFYSDRYYNVFRILNGQTSALKGWYCNITRPAVITTDCVRADDLALDVLVSPHGEVYLLDVDEFAALDLSHDEREAAWAAVAHIREMVEAQTSPFDRDDAALL